ncbi:histidine phosphatase family protein [Dubosiella newyorkensis]|uniref:histidine phosphatase family protein n=1 Tax=Dubosiella newyorkensis TaxID=1862672 RepID=UPI00272C2A3A|nr:histidine phosphatase family protein [Dubosiella newyorkensis]
MTVFYIVCHGETLFSKKGLMQGWCDSPLTNDAIEQTFALSNELKSIHFDGLDSF